MRARRPTEEETGIYDPERQRALFGPSAASGVNATPAADPSAASGAVPSAAVSSAASAAASSVTSATALAARGAESWDQDATDVTARPGAQAVERAAPEVSGAVPLSERATPVYVYAPGVAESTGPSRSSEQAAPVYVHAPGIAAASGPPPAIESPTHPPTHVAASGPRPAIEQATPTELTARPERSEPIRVISMKDRAGEPRGDATREPRVPLHVQLRSMAEVAGVHDRSRLGNFAPPRDPRAPSPGPARSRCWEPA